MIEIETGYLKSFLQKAATIPPNKFLTITEYFRIKTEGATVRLTYTGSGASVEQNTPATFQDKSEFLCPIEAAKALYNNGDKISFEVQDKALTIKCGSGELTVSIEEAHLFHSLIEAVSTESIHFNSELIAAIKEAEKIALAYSEKVNPNYCNIHITPIGEEIEVFSTTAYAMYLQRVKGKLSRQILLSKPICRSIIEHSSIDLHDFENKHIFTTLSAEYAFNKPEAHPVDYGRIMEAANEGLEMISIINKSEFVNFCESTLKLLVRPDSACVDFEITDGEVNCVINQQESSVKNTTTLHGEGKGSESFSFTIHKSLPAFKAIPTESIRVFLAANKKCLLLKPADNDDITTLFNLNQN